MKKPLSHDFEQDNIDYIYKVIVAKSTKICLLCTGVVVPILKDVLLFTFCAYRSHSAINL